MKRQAWSVVSLVVALSACGPMPVEGPAGSVSITVQFRDAVLGYPLVGLTVCVAGRPEFPCVKAGQDGRVRAPLPPNDEVMLECSAPLHITTLMTLATPAEDFDVGVFRLLEKSTADLFTGVAGAPRDEGKGILLVNVYDDLVKRDVRVPDGVPALSTPAGLGPVFGGNAAMPNTGLTAMSAGGPAGFYDLEPGDYTVTLAHPTRTCSPGFGWPGANATTFRTRIFAGGMSTVTWVCPK